MNSNIGKLDKLIDKAQIGFEKFINNLDEYYSDMKSEKLASYFSSLFSKLKVLNIKGSQVLNIYTVLGHLIIFEKLFGDRLDENSLKILTQRKDKILEGLKAIENNELISEFEILLEEELRKILEEYINVINSMINEIDNIHMMSEDDFILFCDEFSYLYDRRGLAEDLSMAYRYLKRPEAVALFEKEIKSQDNKYKKMLRKAIERDPQLFIIKESRILKARFDDPPEIYWWSWIWLEEREKKPLNEIFGFNLKEVHRRLETNISC